MTPVFPQSLIIESAGEPIAWLSRRLGEAGIQEKRVAIDEMWFNRRGEVIR